MKSKLNSQEIIHFPKWLRKTVPLKGQKNRVEKFLKNFSIHSVCEEAKCPNRMECFACGTAAFLLMGNICTRSCSFCNVKCGTPSLLDLNEPDHICEIVKLLNLSYVVLTSVTRDDLYDGGAMHIAETIKKLKERIPDIKIEVLIPDFKGDFDALKYVLESKPDVVNHNIETVRSVFQQIRPEANYELSLEVLKHIADSHFNIPVKSGFMVGLGETEDQIITLMEDLKKSKVTIITIGQYLQPSSKQVPVKEFITPYQFKRYYLLGKNIGFRKILAGTFVRSSYKAEEILT
ncbi:MAG: lipoyl synthase [Chitinispirillia bacterium]|jgi:lipoic acid synthetase